MQIRELTNTSDKNTQFCNILIPHMYRWKLHDALRSVASVTDKENRVRDGETCLMHTTEVIQVTFFRVSPLAEAQENKDNY